MPRSQVPAVNSSPSGAFRTRGTNNTQYPHPPEQAALGLLPHWLDRSLQAKQTQGQNRNTATKTSSIRWTPNHKIFHFQALWGSTHLLFRGGNAGGWGLCERRQDKKSRLRSINQQINKKKTQQIHLIYKSTRKWKNRTAFCLIPSILRLGCNQQMADVNGQRTGKIWAPTAGLKGHWITVCQTDLSSVPSHSRYEWNSKMQTEGRHACMHDKYGWENERRRGEDGGAGVEILQARSIYSLVYNGREGRTVPLRNIP